ncbi:hypothetical protein [Clostridium sp. CF012]|uniref:hypothetical protein n=1 Tax=Clostridium sp. CF012 TaxID=2843319 RepID=UPI001C0BA08F|nr:hypothetical protein [Clostridium sp. CF012]MBU3146626.1 hypothetical protein [Clostridium sp. CF012]
MKLLIKFIGTILAELLLIIGAIFILLATYRMNMIAFYYVLGIMLILTGLFIAKTR